MKTVKFQSMRQKQAGIELCGCQSAHDGPTSPYDWAPWTWAYSGSVTAFSAIDLPKSRENFQNRGDSKIDRDLVNRYANCIARGDELPALVLIKDPDTGKLLLIDGNHTTEAALQLNFTHFQGAYLVAHPEPIQVASILNTITNGKGDPHDQIVSRCVAEYRRVELLTGRAPLRSELAARYTLSTAVLDSALRRATERDELAASHVDLSNLKDTHIDTIAMVRNKGYGMEAVEFAKLVNDFGLTTRQLDDNVDKFLNPKLSSVDKSSLLKKLREHYRAATGNGSRSLKGGRKRSVCRPESSFQEAMTKLGNVAEKQDEARIRSYILAEADRVKAVKEMTRWLARLVK